MADPQNAQGRGEAGEGRSWKALHHRYISQHREEAATVSPISQPALHAHTHAVMKVIVLFTLVAAVAAAKLGKLEEEEPVEPPKPYNFGFEVRDDETTNYQNRAEVSDSSGRVKGSYSYVLPDGFVYTVTYEDKKDGEGLKAVVRKEPSGIKVIIPEPKSAKVALKTKLQKPF